MCVGGVKTGDVSRLARMRFVVRHAGFEPATPRLKVWYSTTELMAHIEGKRGRCGKRMEGHFSHPFIKFSRAFPWCVIQDSNLQPDMTGYPYYSMTRIVSLRPPVHQKQQKHQRCSDCAGQQNPKHQFYNLDNRCDYEKHIFLPLFCGALPRRNTRQHVIV